MSSAENDAFLTASSSCESEAKPFGLKFGLSQIPKARRKIDARNFRLRSMRT